MRPTITAAVIARDEETMLGDCLRGLTWADEVLVLVDAATMDRTREVARDLGARVEERVFDSFAAQRDAALALAAGEWVLFVDADERVDSALRDEVLHRIANPRQCRGFWIPRRNVILGQRMRGGGWSPDYQLRLLRRDAARFDPLRVVHEVALLDGPAGDLDNAFLHFNYASLGEFIRKQERYVGLEAQRWLATHGPPRRRALLGQPLRELLRRFIGLRGYRDGPLGLLLSLLLAWYAGRAILLARRLAAAQRGAQVGHTAQLTHREDELGQ